jgi:RNA polymerase sporulation-specific sigma factor
VQAIQANKFTDSDEKEFTKWYEIIARNNVVDMLYKHLLKTKSYKDTIDKIARKNPEDEEPTIFWEAVLLHNHLLGKKSYKDTIDKIARKNTRGTTIIWEDAAQSAHEAILQAIQANKFTSGGEKELIKLSTLIARRNIIDMHRRENSRQHSSLDVVIPGTNTPVLDTIPDKHDLWEPLEQKEKELKNQEIISKIDNVVKGLDSQYPNQKYLEIYKALKEDKSQKDMASELKISQGTVSKRLKKLKEAVNRDRSDLKW